MIRITAKRDGFRRCGVNHFAVPTEYPSDFFTEGELAVLKGEPMLVVEELEDPAPEKSDPDEGKGKGKGSGAKSEGKDTK